MSALIIGRQFQVDLLERRGSEEQLPVDKADHHVERRLPTHPEVSALNAYHRAEIRRSENEDPAELQAAADREGDRCAEKGRQEG